MDNNKIKMKYIHLNSIGQCDCKLVNEAILVALIMLFGLLLLKTEKYFYVFLCHCKTDFSVPCSRFARPKTRTPLKCLQCSTIKFILKFPDPHDKLGGNPDSCESQGIR